MEQNEWLSRYSAWAGQIDKITAVHDGVRYRVGIGPRLRECCDEWWRYEAWPQLPMIMYAGQYTSKRILGRGSDEVIYISDLLSAGWVVFLSYCMKTVDVSLCIRELIKHKCLWTLYKDVHGYNSIRTISVNTNLDELTTVKLKEYTGYRHWANVPKEFILAEMDADVQRRDFLIECMKKK